MANNNTKHMPYTYLLGWSSLNKWYYGVRFSTKCSPDDLCKTYFTSSKYVKEFMIYNGMPDVIEIRKTFKEINKARDWEYKVLTKINAIYDEKWLNKTNNKSISNEFKFNSKGKIWINNGIKEKYIPKNSNLPAGWLVGRTKKTIVRRKNVVSEETRKKISEANKGRKKPEGFGEIVRRNTLGIKRSKETIQKIKESKKGLASRVLTWKFILNDKEIIIVNLKKYCRENNLNVSCMADVYYGRQKQHRNYKKVL